MKAHRAAVGTHGSAVGFLDSNTVTEISLRIS